MRKLHRRALCALCAILVLSGCSGGSVAVRSGFPPPPASAGGNISFQTSGGSGLALAVVLGAAIAAAVQETTQGRLHSSSRSWVDEPSRPWWQPIDRGWVDRGP
jgi:hypothetical protein